MVRHCKKTVGIFLGVIVLLGQSAYAHDHYNTGSCGYASAISTYYLVSAGTEETSTVSVEGHGRVLTWQLSSCTVSKVVTAMSVRLEYQVYIGSTWRDCTTGGIYYSAQDDEVRAETATIPLTENDVCLDDGLTPHHVVANNEWVRTRSEGTITSGVTTINTSAYTEGGTMTSGSYHQI